MTTGQVSCGNILLHMCTNNYLGAFGQTSSVRPSVRLTDGLSIRCGDLHLL